MISIGYDPKPPGQLKLTKAIVDSDLDGVICAALLKRVYPKIEIYQCDAEMMAAGYYDKIIDQNTVITDLKYHPDCGLYLDHHESNRPDSDKFPGRWQDVNSAGRVVYEYFKQVADFTDLSEVIVQLDKFDMGKISREEFLNPNPVIQLGVSITRKDLVFNALVIELIAHYGFEYTHRHNLVQERIESTLAQREQQLAFIKQHSQIIDNIAVIDVRNYPGKEKLGGYLLVSQFADVDATIVAKKDGEKDDIKIRLYKNEFNPHVKNINLLQAAKQVSPNAGGHKNACGFNVTGQTNFDQLALQIIAKLKLQNK